MGVPNLWFVQSALADKIEKSFWRNWVGIGHFSLTHRTQTDPVISLKLCTEFERIATGATRDRKIWTQNFVH